MSNWILNKKKPRKYIRLNIKDNKGCKHIGFYIGNGIYLESKGKEIIKNVVKWKKYDDSIKIFDYKS